MWVKICGITDEEDALLATALGADALGFVFAPSPRQVAVGRVYDIVRRLPSDVVPIGVFRNEAPARVIEVLNRTGLKGAQLHGHENAEETRQIRSQARLVIKAFAAGSPALDRVDSYGADLILVDAPSPGSGKTFDWSLVQEISAQRPIVLAGGLTPDNVVEAIERVRPWGVDVSSGTEKTPGRKDPAKLRAFLEAANSVRDLPKAPKPQRSAIFDWEQD